MQPDRPFTWTRSRISIPDIYVIKRNTFAILVINIGAPGSAVAFVNGFPINPTLVVGANGESWSVGNACGAVIQDSDIEIIFSTANGLVFMQQVYYIH